MYKNSYMSYGVWIQMMDLDSIEIEKASKKIRGGEGQSPFNKVLKQYDFIYIFLRIKLAKRWTPLNNIMPLKKTLGNKVQEVISRTLTVGPVAGYRLGSLLCLLLVSLAGSFLVSYS
jgi:hypothetical protein